MFQTTELSKPNDFYYNSFHVHLPMVRELVVNTVVNNTSIYMKNNYYLYNEIHISYIRDYRVRKYEILV